MKMTWRRKGLLTAIVSRLSPASRCPLPRDHRLGAACCPLQEAVVPKRSLGSEAPAGDNRGQQLRATIPFSSMSWFSLLQIDVDVEEPGTSENPTRSFEIHNIGSHSFWP